MLTSFAFKKGHLTDRGEREKKEGDKTIIFTDWLQLFAVTGDCVENNGSGRWAPNLRRSAQIWSALRPYVKLGDN